MKFTLLGLGFPRERHLTGAFGCPLIHLVMFVKSFALYYMENAYIKEKSTFKNSANVFYTSWYCSIITKKLIYCTFFSISKEN